MGNLTQARLKEILHYDPDTGIFTRRLDRGPNAPKDSVAGTPDKNGYIVIKVDFTQYKAHRLAWLYIYGVWPNNQIDHINHIVDDNRIVNLRDVTNSENQANRRDRINTGEQK